LEKAYLPHFLAHSIRVDSVEVTRVNFNAIQGSTWKSSGKSSILSLGNQTAARAFSARLTKPETCPLVLLDFPANPSISINSLAEFSQAITGKAWPGMLFGVSMAQLLVASTSTDSHSLK
jgi:hypothetical protein